MASTFSREAIANVKYYTEETRGMLQQNVQIMDRHVNAKFQGLQDPTYQKYLELSENMQLLITQITVRMSSIEKYCDAVTSWMDNY